MITDDDAIQQIRHLCAQLQSLQDRASIREIAKSSIAQLANQCSVFCPVNDTHDTCCKSIHISTDFDVCKQCVHNGETTMAKELGPQNSSIESISKEIANISYSSDENDVVNNSSNRETHSVSEIKTNSSQTDQLMELEVHKEN